MVVTSGGDLWEPLIQSLAISKKSHVCSSSPHLGCSRASSWQHTLFFQILLLSQRLSSLMLPTFTSFCQPPIYFKIWLKIHTSKKPSVTGFVLHLSLLLLYVYFEQHHSLHIYCTFHRIPPNWVYSSISQQFLSCPNSRATTTETDQIGKAQF